MEAISGGVADHISLQVDKHKIDAHRQVALVQQVNLASFELRGQFSVAWSLWQDCASLLTDLETASVDQILQSSQQCLAKCCAQDMADREPTDLEEQLLEIASTRRQIMSALLLLRSYAAVRTVAQGQQPYPVEAPPAYTSIQGAGDGLHAASIDIDLLRAPIKRLRTASDSALGTVYVELPGDSMPVELPGDPGRLELSEESALTPRRAFHRRSATEVEINPSIENTHQLSWCRTFPETLTLRPTRHGSTRLQASRWTTDLVPARASLQLPRLSTFAHVADPSTTLTGRARSRRWLEAQAAKSVG